MTEPTTTPHDPAHDLHRRVRVDWTINLTTIITLVSTIVGGVWWVSSIQASNDKRLALLEAAATAQRAIDAEQDNRTEQELTLIRQSLQRIEDKQDAELLRGARP